MSSAGSGGQPPAGGEVRVDTDKIQQAGDALSELASRLKHAARSFEERSDSFGKPWGDDKTGKTFADNYLQTHSDAVKAGIDGGSALTDAAGQLLDLAAALKAVEAQAVATGRQVAGDVAAGA